MIFRGIFWLHLRKVGFLLFLSLCMIFISGCASLALGKVIGHSVQLFIGQEKKHIFFFGVALFAIFLSFTVVIRSMFSGLLGMKVVQGMSLDLYNSLLKTRVEVIRRNALQIPIILTSDMSFMQNFFGSAAPVLLRNVITFAGSLIALFITEKQLFLYIILSLPFFFVPLFFIGTKVRKFSSLVANRADDFHIEVRESLLNIEMIKAFLKENFFFERLSHLSKEFSHCFLKYVIVRSILIGIIVAVSFLGTALFMDFGLKAVYAGEIGVVTLAEFVFYALFASSSVGRVMELYPDLRQFLNICTRIESLYTEINDSLEDEEVGKKITFFEKLEFQDVSFSYNADGSDAVLKDLSFIIRRGERIALIGGSGGGKSTIFALILGFYFPSSGRISINDIPICEISLASLRKLFAWVPQELRVISGGLAENVCMQSSIEEQEKALYENALRAANVNLFSEDTKVQDLSRGERQRINIARAIFADRQITLLDEATSSLDKQNEKSIESIITGLSDDKTVIIVAHRFSSIKCVDKLIVIEDGKTSAVGTHDELCLNNAFYRQMAEE